MYVDIYLHYIHACIHAYKDACPNKARMEKAPLIIVIAIKNSDL